MIISKKKFKEEIAKAVKERERQINSEREISDAFRNIRNEIDDRFRWASDDRNDLQRRIFEVEKMLGMHDENNKSCDVAVPFSR